MRRDSPHRLNRVSQLVEGAAAVARRVQPSALPGSARGRGRIAIVQVLRGRALERQRSTCQPEHHSQQSAPQALAASPALHQVVMTYLSSQLSGAPRLNVYNEVAIQRCKETGHRCA